MLVSELRSVTQISLKADRNFAFPSALMSSKTHMNSLHGEWGGELAKHFHIWFWMVWKKNSLHRLLEAFGVDSYLFLKFSILMIT